MQSKDKRETAWACFGNLDKNVTLFRTVARKSLIRGALRLCSGARHSKRCQTSAYS